MRYESRAVDAIDIRLKRVDEIKIVKHMTLRRKKNESRAVRSNG